MPVAGEACRDCSRVQQQQMRPELDCNESKVVCSCSAESGSHDIIQTKVASPLD